jgi:CRISPR-associated endonuclease/helicase Cas3
LGEIKIAAIDAFDRQFSALVGFASLSWQRRLFERLVKGDLPAALDLPTGLGKTSVMAIWLIARANGARLPRRLIYVVDRRAVVDQATAEAVKLRDGLDRIVPSLKPSLGLNGGSLPISTLRGQFVDNRDWLADPASSAIIVGTVDMIGSRLLFTGYGVSPKMRPYHAGLLGADALVVLDEAHLVPPFEKLLESIENGAAQFGPRSVEDRTIVPIFRLLSLSATGRERQGKLFRLSEADIDDPLVAQRLNAPKRIKLEGPFAASDLPKAMAERAWEHAAGGRRIIVFCNSRKTAQAVYDDISERLRKKLKDIFGKAAPPRTAFIELIVGARRVRERELVADSRVFKRFSPKAAKVEQANADGLPAFLVCTSAGEVGVDIDADHMVCDLVAWERMVQRFGRVNRLGEFLEGSLIDVFIAASDKEAEVEINAEEIETWRAPFTTTFWLADNDGRRSASPGMLRRLRDDDAFVKLANAATTPAPLRPALTRALLDAWSMTSLEQHTGRPEINPWLRGWVEDEKPQTGLVWRKYLPVRIEGGRAIKEEIDDFFEAAPPHTSEVLETETYRAVDWLLARAAAALRAGRQKREQDYVPDVEDSGDPDPALVKRPSQKVLREDDIVAIALTPALDLLKSYYLRDLAGGEEGKKLKERLYCGLSGATLVVDARLGGLSTSGLLDTTADEIPRTADDGGDWIRPMADGRPIVRFRLYPPAASGAKKRGAQKTYAFATRRSQEGEDLEVISIQSWTTEDSRAASPNEQLLADHQSLAERTAIAIADYIGLVGDYKTVLVIAARLHDEGKKAKRWQLAFNAPRNGGVYAKTKGPIDQSILDHYRHEFGSLPWVEEDASFKALTPDLQDLVLHLVAAHHGYARPIITSMGCQDVPPSALEGRVRDVALRFARLQKLWGPWGLAWWESLLRAADQQASRENDASENTPIEHAWSA